MNDKEMGAYELYKPLRNYLRQFPRLESLGVIRAYLQHLQFGQELPRDIEVGQAFRYAPDKISKNVYEWELEILAKEIILNSPEIGSKDLRRWKEFSTAINKLKKLENELHKLYRPIFSTNVLLELHRVAHRQFQWRQGPGESALIRYFKIFGHPGLEQILKRKVGLSATELYVLGLLFTGFYIDTFGLDAPVNLEVPGVTNEQFDKFVERFAVDLAAIRQTIADAQSYDQDYAYAFNPLKLHPLVWVRLRGKDTLIAPVPTYLFRRFTEGVYFEICDDPGFSAPFGRSFQDYVGDVMNAANDGGTLSISPEGKYQVGKNSKDSVDWILSDNTADIFIECKTKKLRYAAKVQLTSTQVLDEDLDKMAGFVVQAYKTLRDAQDGHYQHWSPSGRPLYPLIVTLEEWYVFGARINAAVDHQIRAKLRTERIAESVLEEHPYSICAVSDFELAVQVMAKRGIDSVMSRRTANERKDWAFRSVLLEDFAEEASAAYANLFPDDFDKIRPDLS